jgi:hypothetical protein
VFEGNPGKPMSMKQVLPVAIVLFILLAIAVGISLYLFLPLSIDPQWDESTPRVVLIWDYIGEVDHNYIPDVQVRGDGRIIWVEHASDGSRRVLEGYLSEVEMTQILSQLASTGFFSRYRRFRGWDIKFGTILSVNLADGHYGAVVDPIDPRSEDSSKLVLDWVDFLKSGAGCPEVDLAPATGTLLAYPVEAVGFSGESEARYEWPDDRFGYALEEVYNKEPHSERRIEGEELALAWEIVNSPAPLVESRDQVYWIAVVVPNVSF